MNEIVKAENIFGFIKLHSQNEIHEYDVTEKEFAIEEINSRYFVNIWAFTSHFEIIPNTSSKVLVGDIGFEILIPIEKEIVGKDNFEFSFPIPSEQILNEWETTYFTTCYNNLYWLLVDCTFNIRKENEYIIAFKGYFSYDGKTIENRNFFIEGEFKTELKYVINSRWNYNFKIASH